MSLERSLALKPDQADTAKMLAAIYLASGDGPRGVDLLKRASTLDSDDFRPWYAMGKVYLDMGELALSADAYGEALTTHPPPAESKASRLGRIRSLLEANRDAEAAAEIDLAKDSITNDAELLGLAASLASQKSPTTPAPSHSPTRP